MSAALLRGRPGGLALQSIASLSGRLESRSFVTARSPLSRALHLTTRPLQRRPLGPVPNALISIRSKSDVTTTAKVAHARRSRVVNIIYKLLASCGLLVVGTGVVIVAFFLYDASTYREGFISQDIPVSELALNPRIGGPKNLPIADVLISDYDSEWRIEQKDKPRLVILGTGWGSVALLKNLNPGDYHVTVVSPTNYFLFTPMLPSATVGTLGLKSLVEPIRRVIERVGGHFLKAEATDVEFSEKLVEVSQLDNDGVRRSFYLPYDKLVVGVGRS